jgi:hypothetical protein
MMKLMGRTLSAEFLWALVNFFCIRNRQQRSKNASHMMSLEQLWESRLLMEAWVRGETVEMGSRQLRIFRAGGVAQAVEVLSSNLAPLSKKKKGGRRESSEQECFLFFLTVLRIDPEPHTSYASILSLSYTSYPVMLFLKSQIKSPQKEK